MSQGKQLLHSALLNKVCLADTLLQVICAAPDIFRGAG